MAGQGTHVRFAVDLIKPDLSVDWEKYLSGAIYPDSRYLTGINRNLTHPEEFLADKKFFNDYFGKGWCTHLLCDRLQIEVIKDKLPELFVRSDNVVYGNELWISLTAIKFIQNVEDMKVFSIEPYLPYLNYVINPNGEDVGILKKYYKLVYDTYVNSLGVLLESHYRFFWELSKDQVVLDKCRKQVDLYLKDEMIMSVIGKIYQEMIDGGRSVWQKYNLF